jgi:hypothetical protein
VFEDAWGFEDDVDIVVSPNREFMVVPEEDEWGENARVRILDLDPGTGEFLGELYSEPVPGYENGVDPFIVTMNGAAGDFLILLPVESPNGDEAKVILLLTTVVGGFLERIEIDLGNLGFREDVDLVLGTYPPAPSSAVAFFALESEIRSVRGVLAIDVDNSDDDWGSCYLLSTDGREACGEGHYERAEWLPGLAEGVDPVAFKDDIGGYLILMLPVTAADGTSDLLRLEFSSDTDPGDIPPEFNPPHISVKDANAGGTCPVSFPGYERDVDLVLLRDDQCGLDGYSVLVPVEGPDNEGDLYLIDHWGNAIWAFSRDSGVPELTIPGYEMGVDLVVMCLPGEDNRVAVPVENADETDADLYIVDIGSGSLLARAEEANPGLTVPGYEIGVDLVRWTDDFLVAPLEGPAAAPGIVTFTTDGIIADSVFDTTLPGFRRSVDPIVVPYDPDPVLIVPFGSDDGFENDVYACFFPPLVSGGGSLEEINPGLELGPFEWDVDLGFIDTTELGTHHLCVPEEAPGGFPARLRFEPIDLSYPNPLLVVATEMTTLALATLYLVDMNTGSLVVEANDLLGLETGIDMTSGAGPVTPGEIPEFPGSPIGVDLDGDPTALWVRTIGIHPDAVATVPPAPGLRLTLPNPFAAPGRIQYVLPVADDVRLSIVNVAGRVVRHLFEGEQPAGRCTLVWDGSDDRGMRTASGIYFLQLRGARGGTAHAKLVLIH